jgi:hypothetical protein
MRMLPTTVELVESVCVNSVKSFVSANDLLDKNSPNYFENIEEYLDAYIGTYFESYLEEDDMTSIPGWKLHSIFKKVSKDLNKDLNEQVFTKRLMGSDIDISTKEAKAIITLFYGSKNYNYPESKSVFYNNKYVIYCLENHRKYLDGKLQNDI